MKQRQRYTWTKTEARTLGFLICRSSCTVLPYVMEMPHSRTANDPNVDVLKAGSEHAFRCLFEQERERLRRFVLKLIDDADEAENIVQETFTEAYRQIEDFRGESSVSTWLFSIARYLAYGHLRTSDRHNSKLARASLPQRRGEGERGA